MKSLFSVFLLAALPLHAGLFGGDFDARKGTAVIRVVKPAERYLNGKTMRVKLGPTPKAFGRQTELVAAIERALSTQFVRAEDGNADLSFEVEVSAYEPPKVHEYEVQEKRRIQVGETPLYNKDGTPKKNLFGGQATQGIYEDRLVPIRYWEGKGRLAIRVTVSPRGSTAAIDSAAATAEFSEKITINDPAPQTSVVDIGRDFGKIIGLGKKGTEASRPTADSLDLLFVDQVSGKACGRFARTISEVPIVLSTEAGLVAGTSLALAGDWAGATEYWQKAAMKNAKNEWMRSFNLGVGHIALAFQAYGQGQDAAQVAALFDQGGQLLLKASSSKPSEKHIIAALQTHASLKTAMQNIATETAEHEKTEERDMKRIAEQRRKILEDNRRDSPKEASFRQLVAVRLRGAKGDLAADDRKELEATGESAYGLNSDQTQRVVFQETERLTRAAAAIGTYEEMFASLVEDRMLSADEQTVLHDLGKNLSLDRRSVEAVHGRYTYDEAPRKAQVTKKTAKQ
ncbi:MAG TPA: hypothetical protein VF883_02320 [Thermoanaerobaculia bacterium]